VVKPGVCEYYTASTKTFRDFSIYDEEDADEGYFNCKSFFDDLIEICNTKIDSS
jgi:hypothetical protein